MKIAKFKSTKFGFEAVSEEGLDGNEEYVRVSEYIDVEFPPRQQAEVVAEQVAAIDIETEKLKDEFSARLNALGARKQELLALTHSEF